MDDQRKEHIDPKTSSEKNQPKKLQSHNMPTYDWKNTYDTNKGRDLFLAHKLWIIPLGTERMLQSI